jgi:glycosyltransferase involved in cell wall biosynthesis
MSKNIVFVCGNGDTLIRFRKELIKRFLELDYNVHAFAPEISPIFFKELNELGVIFHEIKFKRKSVGLINTFVSIIDIVLKFRNIKPDIVFSYTHKSVVVGSICAWIAGVKNSYSLITGTGHIFDSDSISRKINRLLGITGFRFALSRNKKVFFQNPDDLTLFSDLGVVKKNKSFLVNGSGVDLDLFKVTPLPKEPVFICLSRLIKSKGLLEYANAASIVRKKAPHARFLLFGFPDEHYDSIPENEIKDEWHSKFGIEYLGFSSNPQESISSASVYVLLSYNEGTPRSVLEAMSMGRAIVTTDVPGCRETVEVGRNGFLVDVKSPESAALAMEFLLDEDLRISMGKSSREYCNEKFNVHQVNKALMDNMEVF